MPALRPSRPRAHRLGLGGAALLAGVVAGWVAGLLRVPKGPVA